MKSTNLYFKCAVGLGLLLSLLLLFETLMTYGYVERGLLLDEAQREATRFVSSIEHSARVSRTGESSDIERAVDEVTRENPNQIAWIRVFGSDAHVLAAAGGIDKAPKYSREALQVAMEQHRPFRQNVASGSVIAVLSPFFPHPPYNAGAPRWIRVSSRPDLIEVGLYAKGISVNFGPLRQNLVIGVSAAFALLGAALIIGLRFRDYVRAKEVEKEVALARQVQLTLFPKDQSLNSAIQFAARCVPAWQVGGDLYDVFETDDGETAFVLGDVSGKGLSAALLMGVVQGLVRANGTACCAFDRTQAAERLNHFLCGKTADERFVTLFWAYFNADEGILRYVNAGHWPPLLMRGGAEMKEVIRLAKAGPILGVLPDAIYEPGEVAIEDGDLLVAYSDGILEASDSQEQEFGEERLIRAVQQNWPKSPEAICEAIFAEVQSFIGREIPADDQTLLVVRLERKETNVIRMPLSSSLTWSRCEALTHAAVQ